MRMCISQGAAEGPVKAGNFPVAFFKADPGTSFLPLSLDFSDRLLCFGPTRESDLQIKALDEPVDPGGPWTAHIEKRRRKEDPGYRNIQKLSVYAHTASWTLPLMISGLV